MIIRKMRWYYIITMLLIAISCQPEVTNHRSVIELSGKWQFAIDEKKIGISEKWYEKELSDFVLLPGTMDENRKGSLNSDSSDTHLSRLYSFTGPAWYKKEINIPASWNKKSVRLIMERTKVTHVWIDTIDLGTNNAIFTMQEYDLTGKVSAGNHTLTIMVDNNSNLVPVAGSHAYSEDTQTNWNGIIGRFCLEATNPIKLSFVKVYPEISARLVNVKIKIDNRDSALDKIKISLMAESWNSSKKHKIAKKIYNLKITNNFPIELTYELGDKMQLWSEFDPVLYKLSVTLMDNKKALDNAEVDFGMRDFKAVGTQFSINGIRTFLRGKHDACVFPLTGYPPMDTAGWMRVFRIAKSYGINTYRFHSWCPPEAAFKAADICGIYMQPELPNWWGFNANDSTHLTFNRLEGKRIFDNYGNHPSFVMFTLGNEICQDRKILKQLITEFRAYDNRFLYAQGTNNFGGNPSFAEGDDFWSTFRTSLEKPDCSSDVRASISFVDSREGGILNTIYPSTSCTYTKAIQEIPVPVIGHEIGQYQIYPNFSELPKYTGILIPWNLELYRHRLNTKGMGDQVNDFFKASGALSLICYRADIEIAIRTRGFAGFHLLDLQDYPGQGTALVGILDAFMDSKGLITPEEFRHFCNDVVVLLIMDKYCWTNGETFNAGIEIANYGPASLKGKTITWKMVSADSNKILQKGTFFIESIPQGEITSVGKIVLNLADLKGAQKVFINLNIEGSHYKNEYPVWVYPADLSVNRTKDIVETTKLNDDIANRLNNGESVLLFPDFNSIKKNSLPGMFISEFWNYKMFTGFANQNKRGWSPGTMGIFTQPSLPLFNSFPTEFYTNWQWWTILKNSRPLILDNTDLGYRPLVQVIDNINRNYKLGLIMEFKVGKGKLLICCANLPAIKDKPEALCLYSSIIKYMESKDFNPATDISIADLNKLLKGKK